MQYMLNHFSSYYNSIVSTKLKKVKDIKGVKRENNAKADRQYND